MAPVTQSRPSRSLQSNHSPAAPGQAPGRRGAPPGEDASSAAQVRTRARNQARRRQVVSDGWRRFESSLPALLTRGVPGLSATFLPRAAGSRARPRTAALPSGAFPGAVQPDGLLAQLGFSGLRWCKVLSLSLLAAAIVALSWFQSDDRWYLDPADVTVSGVQLVNPGVLMQAANLTGWNVFWLRRDEVRERLLAHPWVDEAKVEIAANPLGAAAVRLRVKEAPVVGLWATELGEFLISPHGAALPVLPPGPAGLPRLIDPTFDASVPGSPIGSAVSTDIVAAALALISRVAGVSEVRYSSEVGLNFSLPGAPLWVYWGDGTQAEEKLAAIEMGLRLVAMGDATRPILDVRNPAKPTLR